MSLSGKRIAGFALLAIGACALLGIFGIHLGGLFAFVFGVIVAVYGLKKLKEGRTVYGIIVLLFALILLGHSLPFLFGLGIAIACIYFGWRMIKRGGSSHHREPAAASFGGQGYQSYEGHADAKYKEVELDSQFESEWKEFLKNQDKNE